MTLTKSELKHIIRVKKPLGINVDLCGGRFAFHYLSMELEWLSASSTSWRTMSMVNFNMKGIYTFKLYEKTVQTFILQFQFQE